MADYIACVFFFSSHYTTPAQCWAQDLARGLNSSRCSWVHGCGMMGQTSRCFMVCSSPHSHVVCPSSLNPHFCIRDLHRPVPVRRRYRLDQVGHVSLEPGGSDSLGLNESLCDVVWRWLDQRGSLRVWALPSRGSTEWRKLCLDFSLFLAGSCWGRVLSSGETQSQGCGADSSGVCSPIGVRQLLDNADPGPGLCLGLSSVVFVREGQFHSGEH